MNMRGSQPPLIPRHFFKKKTKAERQECQPKKTVVSKLCVTAEGGAKTLFHQITKPRTCRGIALLFGKTPQEDAEHEAGMKVMLKEWHARWQGWAKGPRPRQALGKHGAQKSKRKPWLFHGWVRSDGLEDYHGGEGVDGFHPRVPLGLSEKCCGGRLTLVREAEMAEVRPANASTTLFWLIPTSTTSARPIALLPTLKRWWEWLRASACSEYDRDVRKGWETLLELETMDLEGLRVERRQNGKGATALVVELAKAFEKIRRCAMWKWTMYF